MSNLLAEVKLGESISWGSGSVESKFPTIGSLVSIIIQNILTISGVIFIGMLIFGGFKLMMTAGSGDPKQAAQARSIFTTSIIGLAIVFASFLIVQVVEMITGVNILKSNL